jgi:hypothetical protein
MTFSAVVALLVVSAAGDHEWHRYKDVCEKLKLDALLTVPERERDRVTVRLRLAPAQAPKGPVTLTIVAAAGRLVVAPNADGFTDFPVRRDLMTENPMVLTSVPSGVKTQVMLSLVPVLPTGLTLSYADAMQSVTQANRLIRAQAGFFAFAAPRMKGLELRFNAGVAATVDGLPSGQVKADARGVVRLPFDEALLAKDVRLSLSAAPTAVDFVD